MSSMRLSGAEHVARNKVKPVMVCLLSDVVLECGAEKLTFIYVVMPDKLVEHYPEVKRYHKARKLLRRACSFLFMSAMMQAAPRRLI